MSKSSITAGAVVCAAFGFVSHVALSQSPTASRQSFLRTDDDTLRIAKDRQVEFVLRIPGDEVWGEANIGQLQVRTFGKVETLTPDAAHLNPRVRHTFTEPGYAMIVMSVGPSEQKFRTDSVSRTPYCSKMLLRIYDNADNGSRLAQPIKGPSLTAKVGLKAEIRPLINPLQFDAPHLAQGADLPIRVYFDGSSLPQARVTCFGPAEAPTTATTDESGFAIVKINAGGPWKLSFSHESGGVMYTGELVFETTTDPVK